MIYPNRKQELKTPCPAFGWLRVAFRRAYHGHQGCVTVEGSWVSPRPRLSGVFPSLGLSLGAGFLIDFLEDRVELIPRAIRIPFS
jgi:hypothetical protein